jgi:hypothetical protein
MQIHTHELPTVVVFAHRVFVEVVLALLAAAATGMTVVSGLALPH